MPCPHCRAHPGGLAPIIGYPTGTRPRDLPVMLHPVALKQHMKPAWLNQWDEPKICGSCGSWFSEPLAPAGPKA